MIVPRGPIIAFALVAFLLAGQEACALALLATEQFSFFSYLRDKDKKPALIAFSPTNHDPRQGMRKVPSQQSIRADLEALRPAFNGLILYGYDKDLTPTILAEAQRQNYRAAVLGVWDPKSTEEIEGTLALVKQYHKAGTMTFAICIGNEGVAFNRYKFDDLTSAAQKIRKALGPDIRVPVCTSEPFGQYDQIALQRFGDFLCPNIHSVFDRPELDPVNAVNWVRDRALALADIARKPVLVKETGFPHCGDTRFTPEAQREFWAAYVKRARFVESRHGSGAWVSHAAAFEAFDLQWKAEQTKMPIEAAWGLLDAERKPQPAFFEWRKPQSNLRN